MATIRKRGDTYQIRVSVGYDIEGKQITRTKSWKPTPKMTEKQIEKELNRQATLFEEDVKNGLVGDNKQKFSDYARYVLELKERTGVKHTTIHRYRSLLPLIDKAIGHLKLAELHPKHLNSFYSQLMKDGMNQKTGGKLSTKTVIEYHRFISSVLSQAERELLIPFNPARKATPPKAEKHEVNFFQIAEVQKIMECLEHEPLKYRLLVMLLMTTGCRRGEILGLKWGKFNRHDRTIRIDNTVLYRPDVGIYESNTKTGKARTVKIPLEVVELMEQYREWYYKLKLYNGDRWQGSRALSVIGSPEWITKDFVFVQDNGKPMHPDSITKWLKKFSDDWKLPHINPHAFRHTAASILISQGVDVVTVSKMLGHDKVSTTTDIYSHLLESTSEQASDTLADVIIRKRIV